MTWASKIKTEMDLSTIEAELIAMSEGLRMTIPLMRLLEELSEQDVRMINKVGGLHCRVFEDNKGAQKPSLARECEKI